SSGNFPRSRDRPDLGRAGIFVRAWTRDRRLRRQHLLCRGRARRRHDSDPRCRLRNSRARTAAGRARSWPAPHLSHTPPSRSCGGPRLLRATLDVGLEAPVLGSAVRDDEPEWISGWALAARADLLLHDSQYTEDEYAHRLGWGHSSVAHAAAFSRAAGVRQLAMFHHDPMRSDRELEELYDQVAAVVRDEQEPPLIAREGLEVALGAG